LAAWLATAPLLASVLIVRTESKDPDAIIVLSGAAVYTERLQHAAKLYRQGRGRLIVLTNDGLRGPWSRGRQENPTSFQRGADTLVASGVPAEKIVVLKDLVASTYQEALVIRAWVSGEGLDSIVVVTSPYHSRRALWVLRRVVDNSVAIGLDSPPPGHQSPPLSSWWLNPIGWQSVGLEHVKLIYYFLRHG
jgi:uncharacterized SAM-binding protein YcdF (DUF218 family)